MKVLLVHNRYRQPGGEDTVFAAEGELLRREGHDVVEYTDDNRRTEELGRLKLAAETIWSRSSRRKLTAVLRAERPDVAHFHNTFVLVSPSAYRACRDTGVPVVQTLHNYRLLCPAASFFRAGRVCEDCSGRTPPWPGVLHACYRDSRAATAIVAIMLSVHRALETYSSDVDVYIALTEFARELFAAGGLPERKIVVKPNFVLEDPGAGAGDGGYGLFVGRLSPEKGIATLLEAWKLLGDRVPLKIAGDGPLAAAVEEACGQNRAIDWLGHRDRTEVVDLMRRAVFIVVPSEWYENMPMTVLEAFSVGTPVVASDLGALSVLVESGRTGVKFPVGEPQSLAAVVERLHSTPADLAAMRREARAEYEAKYTAEANYRALMEVYGRACGGSSSRESGQ